VPAPYARVGICPGSCPASRRTDHEAGTRAPLPLRRGQIWGRNTPHVDRQKVASADFATASKLKQQKNRHKFPFPRRNLARVLRQMHALERMEGAGNAVRRSHPQPCVQQRNARKQVTTGTPNDPASPAQWFERVIRALPGDRLCSHRRSSRKVPARNLIPASGQRRGDQDHTTSSYVRDAFVGAASALEHPHVHRIPLPTSVTIAIRPSYRGRDRAETNISFRKTEGPARRQDTPCDPRQPIALSPRVTPPDPMPTPPAPVPEHRVSTESSHAVENPNVAVAGAGFHLEQISTGGGVARMRPLLIPTLCRPRQRRSD
jgi:hypothetical protein